MATQLSPSFLHFLNQFFLIFAFFFFNLSRFGFSLKKFLFFFDPCPVLAWWWPPCWSECPHSCHAIGLLLLHLFNIDDIFFPVHLDYLSNIPSLCPQATWTSVPFGWAWNERCIFAAALWVIFQSICEGVLKWHLWFFSLIEMTNRLNVMVTIWRGIGSYLFGF